MPEKRERSENQHHAATTVHASNLRPCDPGLDVGRAVYLGGPFAALCDVVVGAENGLPLPCVATALAAVLAPVAVEDAKPYPDDDGATVVVVGAVDASPL